ncbi:hypothetical protein ACFWNG_07330 [Streptomyces sp. NPDC058391]|uniref:hypothetical protein n=1 Tax=Streptomyces sp. NPDC058391 TaxID=3346476 RepID=UPI0036549BC7
MGLLSWLRGDRADGPDGSLSGTPHGSTASASSGAAYETPAGSARPAAGWRELPPVQRTLTAPGLVTDPDGFRGSLGTWQDATLTTPLGHLVSPQAPSGLVHGLVASSGPTTVSRQVEDGRDEGSRREGMVASWPPTEGRVQVHPRAVPLQRSASEGQETMVSAGALPDGLPVRRLVGERPVESALPAPPELPAPPVPPAPPPSAVPVRDSAPTSGGPPTGPVPAPVQRFTAPQPPSRPHPPGLGAPLAGLPPTAQREIAARTSGPMTEPGGPESPPDTDAPVDTPAVTPVDAPPDTPTGPLLGDAPPLVQHHPHQHVQRATESEPERPGAPALAPGSVPVPVQRFAAPHALPRLPEPASGPVVPLLAQRAVPLFATGPDAPMAPAPRGATPEPPAVPVRWSAPGPEAAAQRSYAAGQVTVAREAVGTGTGAAAGTAPASLGAAPGSVPPRTAQRHALGSPPVPRSVSSGTAAPSPAFRDAGSVAVAAGVAQRMADGSVVFGGAHVVQRAAESSEPPPPDPLPEAEPQPEPDPGLDPGSAFPDAADGGAPRGTESAVAGSPGRGTGTPPVTDELVRALYAPLSRLLKADLRLERERAGFLINTRH